MLPMGVWSGHLGWVLAAAQMKARVLPCSHRMTPLSQCRYYNRLVDNEVLAEMHIWPKGGHGWGYNEDQYIGKGKDKFSYAREQYYSALEAWLKRIR